MSLSDLATVTISTEGPALTQVGFGVLGCAAYHTHNTDHSRTYTALSQLTADGFASTEPGYRMAQRAFQQNPRPESIKILRLATPYTHTVRFTPVSATNSTDYSFTMQIGAVSADIVYTSDSSATIAEIVAGLAAAVEASPLGGLVVAAAGGGNTYTQIAEGTNGVMMYFSDWSSNLKFADVTADPGIAADLDVIRNADADWYGLAIDCNANLIIQAADGWAETQDMLFGANTSDSDAFDSGISTDVGKVLMTASAARVLVGFDLDRTDGYMGVAMLAERFPHDPGSSGAGGTFMGKTLVGVTADALSPSQKANLRAKRYVVYITTAGRNHTLDGKTPSGEFADVARFLDWFRIRTQEGLAAAVLNNDKIEYTDAGIGILLGVLLAQGAIAENVGGFVPGSFSATAVSRKNSPTQDIAGRVYNGLQFAAKLAGAIHLTNVTGSVTI